MINVARSIWGFIWPVVLIAAAILLLGTLGAAGLSTGWILAALLLWVLPVFVGYRLHLSKDRDAPIGLAVCLGWIGVLFALALPPAGRRCPGCDETVRIHATVCKHCGAHLHEGATLT